MSKVILVSAFSNINNAGLKGRTLAIYNQIDVGKTVLTTDFDHSKKQYFSDEEMSVPDQVNLHVPSYNSNLSVKRIWSHIVFAKQVKRYLESLEEKPSAVYCAMPTTSAAYVCAKYCKNNGIKFVVDVIDLWPDSLLPLVKGKAIIKACLFPWTYMTRYAYRHADVIMGESVRYASEAKKYNPKAKMYPIYLGVDVNFCKEVKKSGNVSLVKPEDEVWIGYAGALGISYDFITLLEAIKSIHGRYKYKLWFIGDGVRHEEIATFIKDNNLNAEITGFLPYEQLLGYLSYCDIAVNIFRANTKVVYSFKFNDYVAMDCFVLNSLEGETAAMVDEYQIGRNFNFSNQSLPIVMEDTLAKWDEYSKWKRNAHRLIEEKLDKGKIYSIVKELFN
jgi:glycosyltransferase involved in cell wall biosynthesis